MTLSIARKAFPVFLSALAVSFSLRAAEPETGKPPETRVEDAVETRGGVEVHDPYRWLEDQNAPETRAWIETQNRYSDSFFKSLPGREAIAARLGELLKVDTVTVPSIRAGRYFYSRRKADQGLPVLYVRRGAAAKEEVLVDPHSLSADHSASVSLLDITRDGTLIAYGIRQGGEDEVAVHFLDVDSRKELPDVLPRGRYSGISVTQDRKTIYFSRHEKEGPRVYVHTMGSDFSKDAKLFGDGYGPEKGIGAFFSDDDRYLGILVSHGSAATQTEIYVCDLAKGGLIGPIVNDIEARFSPNFAGDRLYPETNWKAAKGRVLAVDLAHPEKESWKEVVAERDVPIAGVSTVGGKLFVRYLENVLAKTKIFDANGKPAGEISFPAIGTLSGMRGRWDQGEGFFTFVSFVTPTTIYRYDVAKGSRSVWAKENIPIDSDRFEVSQVS